MKGARLRAHDRSPASCRAGLLPQQAALRRPGIYLRHLSRELAALGHHVEVFSGQPYPELEPGPVLRTVPSLDLYREPDPFRWARPSEFRDWIDALEFAAMRSGSFPEPLTFSLRARLLLLARRADFDLVHDNQVLG